MPLKAVSRWDVIIIGGGASGLGIALDCATRGFKTLLLEKTDFAKGTSSRSTKLVHGGVRYLAQGNIDLVREALYERGLMLKNASHLVLNQSFIIPNYKNWDTLLYTVGMKVYDILSGKLSFGKSKHINKKSTIARLETIKTTNLKGGVVYQDGQFDDSRLAINIAQTAIEAGATVLNHFEVVNLTKNKDSIVDGVIAKDIETGNEYSLKAGCVINATGVFTDEVLLMDNQSAKNSIRPSQGIHLVLDKSFLPGSDAIMIPKTDDGRVLFLVPWHNRVIVGTTDTLLDENSEDPIPLDKEIDFVIDTANKYLTKKVSREDVLAMYAGLRPLSAPKDDSEKTKEISRSHKILISDSDLISITGGKWTTYRKMAQDVVNKAIALGKLPQKKCRTKDVLIHGANGALDRTHHMYIYGTDKKGIEQLIKNDSSLGAKIHPRLEFVKAEVIWAIRNEMARTIEDVLARRVRILFLDAKAAIEIAPTIAAILAKELGRSVTWQEDQVKDFVNIANHYVLKTN